MSSPALRDLVTIVYRPRATIRRILDSDKRWTWEVIALASICSSYLDPDIGRIKTLTLTTTIAIAVFGVIVNALVWVGIAYLFAWAATLVGRRLEGTGSVAGMRAAIGWSLVPQVWSVFLRVPAALYLAPFMNHASSDHPRILLDFIQNGGCSIAVVLITVQIALYAVILFDMSSCVGEALHFSTLRGLATVAITAFIPVVIGLAAYFASRS